MSSVAALEQRLAQLRRELKIMKDRLTALVNMKRGLEAKIDEEVNEFNNTLERCRSRIREGLLGFRNADTLTDAIRREREGYYADSNGLGNVRSCLSAEEVRCNNEISRLNAEIAQTEAELAAARAEEAEAARKAAGLSAGGGGGGRF